MKTSAKFIVLHPSINKPGGVALSHRTWLVVFILIFILALAFTFLTTRDAARTASSAVGETQSELPKHIFDAMLHYASTNATCTTCMTLEELKYIAAVLRLCAAPCNLLVFGIGHEAFLWNSLNQNGRTVFVGESAYFIGKLEKKHPSIEAYDVQFTMKVRELYDLIEYFKGEVSNECRPVQNLLFSDCKLAINDLPNHLYDVTWDVILIDGPKGNFSAAAGRMTAIYTAGVLARSKRGGAAETHVFVHEIDRELERVCSNEFLCAENLVGIKDLLGHFVIGKMEAGSNRFGFCSRSGLSIPVSPVST